MPKVDPTQLIYDGFSVLSEGMNDGSAPQRIGPFQAALLINATTRGDFAEQRPGFRKVMTVLQNPPGMFQHFGEFRTDAQQQFLIAVVAGRFFRIDPLAATVLEITIPGDPNPSILERGWSCQGETFWLYNDGLSPTFIWNGGNARRATTKELGPGGPIAYVQGRVWYANPDGLSFRATDLVGNRDSGTPAYDYRDSILRETENDFLNEGGDFRVPADSGEITAMIPTAILDTSQGQGPLIVLCERNAFTVNTPVDRTIWKNVRYPIQTVALIGTGCSGAQNTLNVNADIFFRAPDGIRSFIIAQRQFRDWANTPQSWEMSGLLGFDQQDLLKFGSAAVLDNRMLMTISPAYSSSGVYHRGLAVMDLSPITSILSQAPPVYDGLWTGLNILSIRQTVDGTFMLVLEDDGSIALWQMTLEEEFDDGDGRIQWTVVPRTMFQETSPTGVPGRSLKRLETADAEYDSVAGLVDFRLSWAPDAYPCPTIWHEWKECVQDCFTNVDCNGNLVFQTGYQPRKRMPEPPDVCAVGAKRPLRNFYTLNPRLDVTGPARLLSLRFGASLRTEPKYDPNSCDTMDCVPIQCCGFDPFSYRSKGSEGGYSSGSGTGGSGGGSSGGTTPPVPPVVSIPTWPVPEPYDCQGDTTWLPPQVVDPQTGLSAYVGINPGALDPQTYLSAYSGCIESWSAAVWSAFLASGTAYSQARLIWALVDLTGKNFMGWQVYPNQSGWYNESIDLNWAIVTEYCP